MKNTDWNGLSDNRDLSLLPVYEPGNIEARLEDEKTRSQREFVRFVLFCFATNQRIIILLETVRKLLLFSVFLLYFFQKMSSKDSIFLFPKKALG